MIRLRPPVLPTGRISCVRTATRRVRRNSHNQKHASGVWETKSPTGVDLGEAFYKANFDHSDGKPWATIVFNAVTGKYPKKTREGIYYPSTKDRPRFYELYSRAITFVPRIAPFRSNIDNIDPNQRLFPSENTSDPVLTSCKKWTFCLYPA